MVKNIQEGHCILGMLAGARSTPVLGGLPHPARLSCGAEPRLGTEEEWPGGCASEARGGTPKSRDALVSRRRGGGSRAQGPAPSPAHRAQGDLRAVLGVGQGALGLYSFAL